MIVGDCNDCDCDNKHCNCVDLSASWPSLMARVVPDSDLGRRGGEAVCAGEENI